MTEPTNEPTVKAPYVAHALRLRRERTKGFRTPEDAIYVGRPTMWGNPFGTAEEFRHWLAEGQVRLAQRELILTRLHELKGKRLTCWCPLDRPCHADVLAELAEQASQPATD